MAEAMPVDVWSIENVLEWTQTTGLSSYQDILKDNEIDGASLMVLTENDLEQLFPKAGPRAKFRSAVKKLKDAQQTIPDGPMKDLVETKARFESRVAEDAQQTIPDGPMKDLVENKARFESRVAEDAQQTIPDGPMKDLAEIKPRFESRVAEKKTAACTMTKATQITLHKFMQSGGKMESFSDKYAEVRRIGFKVYDEDFINKQARLKQSWLRYWNDTGLELARKKVPRINMEGMIKKSWSYDGGRKKACVELGQQLCDEYHIKQNPFNLYLSSAEEKEKLMKKIEEDKKQVEENLNVRIHAGTISSNDKISKRNHLKKLDMELETIQNDYSKILTNWTSYLNKIQKTGFQKLKRGPKPKQLRFKTAKELKGMCSETNALEEDSDPIEVMDYDGEVGSGNDELRSAPTTHSREIIESDRNSFSSQKTMDTHKEENQSPSQKNDSEGNVEQEMHKDPEFETLYDRSEDETCEASEHETHLGVKVIFPGVCQNTILDDIEQGSNACTGISLQLAECFRTDSLKIDKQSILQVFPRVVKEMVMKFRKEHLELMDIKTALTTLNFDHISVHSEVFWHELLDISSRDPVEACAKEYKASVNSSMKEALAFTLAPDKTFILLIDEEGKQLLVDSHVRYSDSNQDFDDAIKRKDLHGLIAYCTKESNMLMYIFAHLAKEIKATPGNGCMYKLKLAHPKNM